MAEFIDEINQFCVIDGGVLSIISGWDGGALVARTFND